MLVGTRVYLQPFSEADLPVMLPWWNDARTRRWARTTFPETIENNKRFLSEFVELNTKSGDLPFAIWSIEEKRQVGYVGIHAIDWANRNAWIGLTIGDKAWWGQGVAGEVATLIFDYAFGELGLHKITTGVFSPNERSLGVASKLLTHAGIERDEWFVDGKYIDGNIFEIFERDWATMHARSRD